MTTGQQIIERWLGREYSHNEKQAREKCEHDWTVKGYSPPVPWGTLSVPPEEDAPEFVFWICRQCGTEEMEPFE